MQTTYIFGHKIPDTDTVCASIALSYLKNQLGEKTEPRVLGTPNRETKFVLDYFKIPEPKFLNDVKLRVKNMDYIKNAYIEQNTSIYDTYEKMKKLDVKGLPLVDKNNKLTGYVNVREISRYLIENYDNKLNSSYKDIIKTLKGKEILKINEEIKGNITIAPYKSKCFIETNKLSNNDILIVGNRNSIIEYAIKSSVKLIIIVEDGEINNELLNMAKKKKINIISTSYDIFKTSNLIRLCNKINIIKINENPISCNIFDYRKDFMELISKYGHTNYPITDKKNTCLGMARLIDINSFHKQKVILVDHNQASQSVDGLEEAEIVEIVDHHNLGTIVTSTPINFRISPVGCTCTLLYKLFKESNIEIPANIAGIMLSSIISDTLLLKSPTTTKEDIEVAKKLAKKANLDLYKFGKSMFESSSSVSGMSVEEIIHSDMKTFKYDKTNMVIAQSITTDFASISKRKKEFINSLNSLCNIGSYNIALLFVTDVIKNGSYIFYNESSKNLLQDAYGIENLEEGTYIDGVVSRKKQMLPPLIELIER